MKYLNLDKDFTPFGESIKHESFYFPDGTYHIKLLEEIREDITIVFRVRELYRLYLRMVL